MLFAVQELQFSGGCPFINTIIKKAQSRCFEAGISTIDEMEKLEK
jgi:hypothetical protein